MSFDSKLNIYIYLAILIAVLLIICIIAQIIIIKKILYINQNTLATSSQKTRSATKEISTLAISGPNIVTLDGPFDMKNYYHDAVQAFLFNQLENKSQIAHLDSSSKAQIPTAEIEKNIVLNDLSEEIVIKVDHQIQHVEHFSAQHAHDKSQDLAAEVFISKKNTVEKDMNNETVIGINDSMSVLANHDKRETVVKTENHIVTPVAASAQDNKVASIDVIQAPSETHPKQPVESPSAIASPVAASAQDNKVASIDVIQAPSETHPKQPVESPSAIASPVAASAQDNKVASIDVIQAPSETHPKQPVESPSAIASPVAASAQDNKVASIDVIQAPSETHPKQPVESPSVIASPVAASAQDNKVASIDLIQSMTIGPQEKSMISRDSIEPSRVDHDIKNIMMATQKSITSSVVDEIGLAMGLKPCTSLSQQLENEMLSIEKKSLQLSSELNSQVKPIDLNILTSLAKDHISVIPESAFKIAFATSMTSQDTLGSSQEQTNEEDYEHLLIKPIELNFANHQSSSDIIEDTDRDKKYLIQQTNCFDQVAFVSQKNAPIDLATFSHKEKISDLDSKTLKDQVLKEDKMGKSDHLNTNKELNVKKILDTYQKLTNMYK